MLLAGVYACGTTTNIANAFDGKDFLKLQDAHKKFWIEGAVDALAQVASAKSNDTGKCVMSWYYGDKKAERNSLILASMGKYPDARPSAIMLALAERACGTFRK